MLHATQKQQNRFYQDAANKQQTNKTGTHRGRENNKENENV